MPKAAPTITTTRRVLLAGAGALASAAAALPAGHPDAAMIAAAARVSELDQQIEALTGHLVRIPREIDDLAEVLLDEWWRLLEVVTKGQASTLPGLRAKAAALDLLLPRKKDGTYYKDDLTGRLTFSLVQDLVR